MGISVRPASMVKMQGPAWLWPGWLAEGKLHLLAGEAGTGKTTVAMDLAAIISRGGKFPDGHEVDAGMVLIWTGEDDVRDTLTPRLHAAGADLEQCKFINGSKTSTGNQRAFNPLTDIPLIEESLDDLETPPKLLIVDPIVSFTSGSGNQAVRSSLYPLVKLAEKYGMAILGITHVVKNAGRKSPKDRVLGAQAFVAIARIVMMTAKTSGDSVLVRIKSNIGPDGGAFPYNLHSVDFDHEGERIHSSFVEWGEMVDASAEAILSGEKDSEPLFTPAIAEAMNLLTALLGKGPCLQTEVMNVGGTSGLSYASIRRAKTLLDIHSFRHDNRWWWQLPKSHPRDDSRHGAPQGAQTDNEHLEPLVLLTR